MNNYQRYIQGRRRRTGLWPVAIVGIAAGVYGLVLCALLWLKANGVTW